MLQFGCPLGIHIPLVYAHLRPICQYSPRIPLPRRSTFEALPPRIHPIFTLYSLALAVDLWYIEHVRCLSSSSHLAKGSITMSSRKTTTAVFRTSAEPIKLAPRKQPKL